MTEPNEIAEPSGASGGSGVCPYVTGTVTRYCTLTPFTLTDAEREAVEYFSEWCIGPSKRLKRYRDTLRGLLERVTKHSAGVSEAIPEL